METIITVTPNNERYPTELELYIKDEWGRESKITIPKWKIVEVVDKLKKFISINNHVSGNEVSSKSTEKHEVVMNEKAEFAAKVLKRYALENQIPARSTSDLSPMEEWLILRLFAVIKSLPDSDEIRMKARELDEKDFAQWILEIQKNNVL